MKKIQSHFKNPYILVLAVLTCIGLFLRLYNLNEFVTFLGDQGRDAIVLKRIVTLEHIPAIGAPSSVGQVFLGPFYYYFIAPWLLVTNFDPIGPAIGVALFSSLLIPLVYYLVADLFNKNAGLFTAALVTFSGTLVALSRYSWNPNLLPLFSILAVYALIKAVKTGKWWYFVASGAFFSFCIQLHYVSLAAGVAVIGYLSYYVSANRKHLGTAFRNVLYMIVSFVVCAGPLIIFDIKHDLINLTGFLNLFSDKNAVSTSRGLGEILYTFSEFNTFALLLDLPQWFYSILLLVIVASLKLKDWMYRGVTATFLSVLVITAYFTAHKFVHYFGFMYVLYYVILAYLMTRFLVNKKHLLIAIIVIAGFIYLQIPRFNFLWHEGGYQIERAERIARSIYNEIDAEQYQIGSLPEAYGDSTQRYFLELWGKTPLERNASEKGDELFILCEDDCWPIGSPQWNIAYFAPTKVAKTWEIEGVTIYKLTR